jgi:hypothetical protein
MSFIKADGAGEGAFETEGYKYLVSRSVACARVACADEILGMQW